MYLLNTITILLSLIHFYQDNVFSLNQLIFGLSILLYYGTSYISQLIILPDTFNSEWQSSALVTSLNGRSIYRVKFEDKSFNKITYMEKIYIGERIRDIKYVDKLNFIVVALERTGDIGILKNY